LTLRAKVGGCCHCYCYYPHILPVKQPPVLQLLSRPYWGLSPRRRDIIHGLAWNLARRRGPNGTNVPNFTLMRQYLRVSGPRSPRMAKLSTFSAILRFVAPQGELIHGLAWNLARRPRQRAKSHANAWIFGAFRLKKPQNGKIVNFFGDFEVCRPAGRIDSRISLKFGTASLPACQIAC